MSREPQGKESPLLCPPSPSLLQHSPSYLGRCEEAGDVNDSLHCPLTLVGKQVGTVHTFDAGERGTYGGAIRVWVWAGAGVAWQHQVKVKVTASHVVCSCDEG